MINNILLYAIEPISKVVFIFLNINFAEINQIIFSVKIRVEDVSLVVQLSQMQFISERHQA
ncbi:hypothetical protein T06_6641 [Trichinella sp. T6]|nr:hypothetical protein T06_6641 [Trichinella sp. T6]